MKDFFRNLKDYFDVIVKLDFKGLAKYFFELLIIIFMACFVYVPMAIVNDVLLQLLKTIIVNSDLIFNVYTLVFKIIEAIMAFIVFVHLFNKRYEDLKHPEKKVEVKEKTETKDEDFSIELPKEK